MRSLRPVVRAVGARVLAIAWLLGAPAMLLPALLLPRAAAAQGAAAAAPKRPRLAAGADTNDALYYLMHGAAQLDRNPREAAAAFYWAARIDPTSSDALYGQRVAGLLADQATLVRYMDGDTRVRRDPAIRRLDSLQMRAELRNPLFFRRYDRDLLTTYLRRVTERYARQASGSVDNTAIGHAIEVWLTHDAPEWMRAWALFGDGRLDDAQKVYAKAIGRARAADVPDLQAERARILAQLGRADSAVALFRLALGAQRKEDTDRLVFAYDSKAQLEYIVASLLEAKGDTAAAREGYGRALTEELTYWPAHRQLALLALAAGDTATAIRELRDAVQVAGEDAELRYLYGTALAVSGDAGEAVTQLAKATQLEPLYADPWFMLGRLHEAAGMPEDALGYYNSFLGVASQRHGARTEVEARVKGMTSGS